MILLLGALGELAEGSTRGEMISDVGAPRESRAHARGEVILILLTSI